MATIGGTKPKRGPVPISYKVRSSPSSPTREYFFRQVFMSSQSLSQNKRVTGKEQYYTPMEVARKCLEIVDEIKVGGIYLEPAGGTGSFLKVLGGREWVSYDIEPKYEGVQWTDDFLKEDISYLRDVISISNPPFGRANKLSVPFFNKCAEVSEVIGFLVPKSWRKWSVMNRLDRRFHLVVDVELECDFDYESPRKKSSGKLATVFQVWERREYDRELYTAEDRGYITKTSYEDADVSLTIFGRGCGKVRKVFPRKANTTQMFLKCNEEWVLDALYSIDFSRFYNNVAFVEALSIKEIMYLLNEYRDS